MGKYTQWMQDLDTARLVRYNENLDVLYAWFGHSTIIVFDHNGIHCDMWALGHRDDSKYTVEDAHDSMQRRINQENE